MGLTGLQPATVGTISDVVYQQLRDAIVYGRLRPDQRLRERDLAMELRVSTTPVREALRRLEQDGLVLVPAYRGAVVVRPSVDDINELYMVRSALESLAGRLAATARTDAHLKKMAECLSTLPSDEGVSAVEDAVRRNDTFHWTLWEASGSRLLVTQLASLWARVALARSLALSTVGRLQEAADEHRAIFVALRDRRPDLVEQMIVRHFAAGKSALLHRLA